MRFIVLICLVIGLASCQNSETSSDLDMVNSRPQGYDQFIAIAKLKQPALLSAMATNEKGESIVDDALKAAVIAEQEAFVASLTAISSELKILYQYKLVMNAVVFYGPKRLESQVSGLAGIAEIEGDGGFERPAALTNEDEEEELQPVIENIESINSVSFIGGTKVHKELTAKNKAGETVAVKGDEITVGIIDTGIDYTHSMFGGVGTKEAYEKNNKDEVEAGSFPTAKVTGGIDLVGTEYNAASPNFDQHIPKPDQDPIDEGGHGSHVAGSVAGIGDNKITYDGVAPSALLHAIKVFGKDGSTSTSVIIAGLEYAADPNGDLDVSDKLDVVNLSLGSSFGSPVALYNESVNNLSLGGTVVVASAGNSGHNAYITGSPGTSESAISVAASIDNMEHNYKFGAVNITLGDGIDPLLTESIESTFSTPIKDVTALTGEFAFIGTAAEELTEEQQKAVKGKVALIDRGLVSFYSKVEKAVKAGAIGAVIANNKEGDAFRMGGSGDKLAIPAIMITKELGDKVKAAMANGAVTINFKTPKRIEKPWVIDTLTSFSSRGPRSLDALMKPEISAPGYNIISAKMGGGSASAQMSGTSMAAPHVAGVVALMRQYRPEWSPAQVKAAMMATASNMKLKEDVYPIAQQGAGRVDAFAAASAVVGFTPSGLSLGQVAVLSKKTIKTKVSISNFSAEEKQYKLSLTDNPEIILLGLPDSIKLAANETKTIDLIATISVANFEESSEEIESRIFVKDSADKLVSTLPILAVARKTTVSSVSGLSVDASHAVEAEGAIATLDLVNKGKTAGTALPFNLIANDERAPFEKAVPGRYGPCDLEAAGYKVVEREMDGKKVSILQIGVKLYNPVTSWDLCEISVQLDANGDGVAEQELVGKAEDGSDLISTLYDAEKLRSIRKYFESKFPEVTRADYTGAELRKLPSQSYRHSTVAVVSALVSDLATLPSGLLSVKIAVLGEPDSPIWDDFLGNQGKTWGKISLGDSDAGYVGLPEVVELPAFAEESAIFTKGGGANKLVVFFPENSYSLGRLTNDKQMVVVKPVYE